MMFRRRKSSNKKKTKKDVTITTSSDKETTSPPPESSPPIIPAEEQEKEQDPWSEDNFQAMANQYNLTEQQQDAMLEMKQRLCDIDHWKNDPFEIIRFLKECKYNVKSAETKFRKMMSWRLDNNIDNFLQSYGTPHPLFDYYPSVVLRGVDHDGDPIFIERPGPLDAWGFYKEFGTQGLVDYVYYRREKDITRNPIGTRPASCGPDWQREYYEPTYGRRVGQFTAIMDVEGLNRNHMRAALLPLLNQVARLTQDYYAGVAKRIIVFRAPAIFKVFWNIVKNFFDPCIREIVIFTTPTDYLDVLDEYMDRSILPPEIDSEQQDGKDFFMPGFDTVQFQGGFVTKELIDQCNNNNNNKLHNKSSFDNSITETTSYCGSSTLESDDDDVDSYRVSEGVTVVSGLLGGGSFTGEAIYLRGTSSYN